MPRDQGSRPTPKGFRYYRQGLTQPNTVQGSKRRGSVLTHHKKEPEDRYAEINKKLKAHEAATFGKVTMDKGEAQDSVSRKIALLIREGKKPDQAAAIAHEHARKKGYKAKPKAKAKKKVSKFSLI